MNREAILHVPLSQFAFAMDEHHLRIRIRAAKNDIQSCKLYYGDRVDTVEPIRVKECSMVLVARDEWYDYFETDIIDKYTRVCYYFVLSDGNEELEYYSIGFVDNRTVHRTEYFQFPYIRREDILDIPKWTEDAVMYHIFPDSFASGCETISDKKEEHKIACADGETVSVNCHGGTLNGIIANLDYLESMNVNVLYLNPIFVANSYHKYDTIDYFHVDPCFGTDYDLVNLVKQCHERGIRVILDGVFNHSGPDFFAFRDVLAKGDKSEYFDWFYEMPAKVEYTTPPNYEAFAYVKEMPKLNTGNPKVRDYLIKVGTYWIEEADIDGWRLDVANEIDHEFWREYRKAVRKIEPDFFLIGEIWEEAYEWLKGDQFDSTMNYTFSNICRDYFATRTIDTKTFDQKIHGMMMRYPTQTANAQMNLLDSHDVPRFLYYCDGDHKKKRLAFFYLMMSAGVPSVFYGDECDISGNMESEYRAPMPWKDRNEMFTNELASWIDFRRKHKVIATGRYGTLTVNDNGMYVFERYDENDAVLIAVNNSDEPISVKVSKGDYIEKSGKKEVTVELEAMGCAYLSL